MICMIALFACERVHLCERVLCNYSLLVPLTHFNFRAAAICCTMFVSPNLELVSGVGRLERSAH